MERLHRINLENTVFEGENNAYVLQGDNGRTILLDTGIQLPETLSTLQEGIRAAVGSVDAIDDILLTHYHEDHAGLTGDLQQESGATVHAPAGDADLISGDDSAWKAIRNQHLEAFDEWGVPAEKQDELLEAMFTLEMDYSDRPTVEQFSGGEQFDLGSMALEAIHLPGHTVGHCGFRYLGEGRNELFSGDALLPHYTPNVGGADIRVEDALATYMQTLDIIISEEFDRAWPGHRSPIDDPAGRAREIQIHHIERTDDVINVLEFDRPKNAWTVSNELFGELHGIHILHGPGEADAHLDHLASHGVAEQTAEGYQLVDEAVDSKQLFDSV